MTTAADTAGLRVLVADSKDAYKWRTAAVLAEPGTTDEWIGQDCLMDRSHVAVAYAPRSFTNQERTMERGAFTAIVDLNTGRVAKLPFTTSLAYFNPGCNSTTHMAAFTAIGASSTRITTVDTSGHIVGRMTPAGEITSAVPSSSGHGNVVAAEPSRVVQIDPSGRATMLARTVGTAYDLRPDGNGVAFLDQHAATATAHVLHGGTVSAVASGPLASLGLQSGSEGRVFAVGDTSGHGGWGVSLLPHAAAGDTVSTEGRLAVRPVLTPSVRSAVQNVRQAGRDLTRAGSAEPLPSAPTTPGQGDDSQVTVDATSTVTGKKVTEQVSPPPATAAVTGTGQGKAPSPALSSGGSGTKAAAGPADTTGSSTTIDTDRYCAVPRNDPNTLALQPTPNQIEWAVDMAVQGNLRSQWITQGSWRDQEGVGTVDPQGLFPYLPLTGGGHIPAQVLLGILAQESNLWQAEPGAIPGQMGSPLASFNGFYGRTAAPDNTGSDYWSINWANSDCGYGVGQVTDGMRLPAYPKPGETELPANVQRAVAIDYSVNVAAAAAILANKWNEIHQSGQTITVNDDNPAHLEDWFAALWDYNSGLNPASQASANGNWGLGWFSNPANPFYDPSRGPFLDGNITCSAPGSQKAPVPWSGWTMCTRPGVFNVVDNPSFVDAAHPANWPYEEKVLGWAAESIDTGYSYDSDGNQDRVGASGYNSMGFRPAWWDSSADRITIKPPLSAFCSTSANACDPTSPPPCELQHLGSSCDTPHWWHQQNTNWKADCSTSCGHENVKYVALRTEPGRGYNLLNGEPQCSGGLPSGAEVVTSVPNGTPTYSSCGNVSGDAGTFSFNFQADSQNHYEAKEGLYQVGGGWGGHFWYSDTRSTTTGVENTASNALTPAASSLAQVTAPPQVNGDMAVTGSWKLSNQMNGWTRVIVHVPDTGATTQQAIYTIHLGDGTTQNRIIDTHYRQNTWLPLGVFHFVPGSDFQGVTLTNFAYNGTADSTVAWDAMAFQSLPGKPANFIVQLGESYSSGDGAGSYYPDTATGPYSVKGQQPADQQFNRCLRSQNSWIRQSITAGQSQTLGALSDAWAPSLDLHSVACSGAVTTDADPGIPDGNGVMNLGGDGEYGEVPQLYSGFLDANTTLVTMTMGGDDAGFSSIATACALTACPSDSAVQAKLTTAITRLGELMDAIHSQAPNAKIVLLGYPLLFNDKVVCVSAMNGAARTQLDAWGADMASKQMTLAVNEAVKNKANITFYQPTAQFTGHADCDSNSGINDLVTGPSSDDPSDNALTILGGPFPGGVSSFHPNAYGASLYAQALEAALTM